jgi:methyl-accepting chemotaxis protein
VAEQGDNQQFEQLRQEFAETIDELRKDIEDIRKEMLELRGHIKGVQKEVTANTKQTMVVWEKTSGTLGDITRKISDMAKPFYYGKDNK